MVGAVLQAALARHHRDPPARPCDGRGARQAGPPHHRALLHPCLHPLHPPPLPEAQEGQCSPMKEKGQFCWSVGSLKCNANGRQ